MNSSGSHGSPKTQVGNTTFIQYTSRNKLRAYNFTLNNYTMEEAAHLARAFLKLKCLKFAFQEEIGRKNFIPHLQGCVFFRNQISFNTMKKINTRVHWSKLDHPKRAIEYCLKEKSRKLNGQRWTHGIIVSQYIEVPLLPHEEMCENLKNLMLEENEKDYAKIKDMLHYKDLWASPHYGFGENV